MPNIVSEIVGVVHVQQWNPSEPPSTLPCRVGAQLKSVPQAKFLRCAVHHQTDPRLLHCCAQCCLNIRPWRNSTDGRPGASLSNRCIRREQSLPGMAGQTVPFLLCEPPKSFTNSHCSWLRLKVASWLSGTCWCRRDCQPRPELPHDIEWRRLRLQKHPRLIAARRGVVLSEGRIHRILRSGHDLCTPTRFF